MIRGLIFDFDGLILDTEASEFQSWQEVYREYGHELPQDQWVQCIGGEQEIHFEPYSYLESLTGSALPKEELRVRRRQRHLDLIELCSALPGVEQYLLDAQRLGLKLAVASNSSRDWVTGHLSRLKLLDYFELLACGNEVAQRKPQPDVYLAALNGLGIESAEGIAFEDSPHGITAARSAGLFCVTIPNPLTATLKLDHANLRLSSLEELALAELLPQVEAFHQAIY
ncbi:hypothetical protein KTT_33930 [Tengunoibacter tsumagoiensis]|uniref:Haloacid dehalogenase n=2 Tax=Tengunoibacter tsumagoiensis TaxID=2014871 RepID=A0A402A319_9CHLR|nr:hypothetical protein KTT_33930 [Tengunoibacter tsumagoiensis]